MTAIRSSRFAPSAEGTRLIVSHRPHNPSGVAVLLHGGTGDATRPVSRRQLSVLRMVPTAGAITVAGRRELAVVRVLNAFRGWGKFRQPVVDAHWAIEQVQERFGDLPIALVGHSLGGSVALAVADAPAVRAVVALAPWLSGDEPADRLADKHLLVVHGARDRITNARLSAALVRRAHSAKSASFVDVPEGNHALLRPVGLVDAVAAQFVLASLTGAAPSERRRAGRLAAQALASKSPLTI